jgi:hypothetical protein
MGFWSGLWAGQSISGILLSTNHSLTDLALWQGALICRHRQLSPNWSSTVDSMQWVKMSLYPSASKNDVFRFRSVNNIVIAPARTGKDNSSSSAVIATAHTKRGIRSGFMFMGFILILTNSLFIGTTITVEVRVCVAE